MMCGRRVVRAGRPARSGSPHDRHEEPHAESDGLSRPVVRAGIRVRECARRTVASCVDRVRTEASDTPDAGWAGQPRSGRSRAGNLITNYHVEERYNIHGRKVAKRPTATRVVVGNLKEDVAKARRKMQSPRIELGSPAWQAILLIVRIAPATRSVPLPASHSQSRGRGSGCAMRSNPSGNTTECSSRVCDAMSVCDRTSGNLSYTVAYTTNAT
eukprot:CAMPEP_0185212506 /NCGR_PEP_ID=MMETSP1140-20130426/67566_1 /TAXON_ID=298111 /ORGANISM="Pavlova sp., Strain CCMP459" /LENGTH=213 /DNA_ID=CAMNT_0027780363 /DNA_START=103 /DNA_END=744 /DNA_ORIENTATION=-